MCCLFLLVVLIQIPIFLLYPAGLIRYAQQGGLNSFFQFGHLWAYVRTDMGQYAYAVLITILAGFAGGFVPILGQAWSQLASGHALGQLVRLRRGGAEATNNMETPFEGL
jgi:hypothetical protein